MMRFSGLRWARKDMVELLLRRGRLLDIQMLSFFNNQVDEEVAKLAAGTGRDSAATAAADSAKRAEAASAAQQTAPILSLDEKIRKLAQAEKSSLFHDFGAQCRKVRAQAMTAGPASWMSDVYGSLNEWSTSYLSHTMVTATFVEGSSHRQVRLTGRASAAGGHDGAEAADKLPESVQVVVRVPRRKPPQGSDGDDASGAEETAVVRTMPEYLAVSVKLRQEGGKVEAKMVNGLLEVRFRDALGAVKVENVATTNTKGETLETVYKDPAQIAARQHVLTASAYAGLLAKMEEVVAQHITTTSHYDGLLVRNPAVQMRLSQLACFRYGIESLMGYVIGDSELDAQDAAYIRKKVLLNSFVHTAAAGDTPPPPSTDASAASNVSPPAAETREEEQIALNYLPIIQNERQSLFELPLLESVVLNIYAENALMDGMDCAWHIVRDYPLTEKVPHKSRPDMLIDYPYLHSILDTTKYSITSADGSMEMQSMAFLSPLLGRSAAAASADGATTGGPLGAFAGITNSLQELIGLSGAGHLRLTAPHVNLRLAAGTVEADLHALLAFVDKERCGLTGGAGGDAADPAFVFCVANYLAEVFANIAVLYRCTAALNADEEGLGHREWLLAQSFTAASNTRRRKYLTDYQLMRAAVKAVGAEESYATHPVELMNAAARRKESGSSKAGEAKGKKAAQAPR